MAYLKYLVKFTEHEPTDLILLHDLGAGSHPLLSSVNPEII